MRYGLRALEELARAEASVAVPAPTAALVFSPASRVSRPARDGAALSLRLFSPTEDATRWVLRDDDRLVLTPPPARAAALFEAHVAAMASDGAEDLVVGFPVVTFWQQGQRRTAPLLSWAGASASWRVSGAAWRLPPGTRVGAALELPTGLHLVGAEREEDTPRCAPHAGLWSALFDLDPVVWSALPGASPDDPAALVRAATRLLVHGDDEDCAPLAPGALTRDDVRALCDAARARAAPRLAVECHPLAMAMLLPRGDPTGGLRQELRALETQRAPSTGPLAVYLGGAPTPSQPGLLLGHGDPAPTPSQVRAARAFEGTHDLVAVRGPPGCGKTALVHHLVANAIVESALGGTWRAKPERGEHRWALVLTSTNNAAVDHALAPFTRGRALPVGLRIGNRRSLAEATAATLRAALEALEAPSGPSLPSARAHFEARSSRLRKQRADWREALSARAQQLSHRSRYDKNVALPALPEAPEPDPSLVEPALAVRDAWAWTHRAKLLAPLREALGLALEERLPRPGRPLPRVLADLAPLFPVAGCTLLSFRAAFPMEEALIDRLVVDEAGQCAPVYAVPALARARRALFTGDTAQLPPVYTLADDADERLAAGLSSEALAPFRMGCSSATSAQAVAAGRVSEELCLTEHFRSQPEIVALASAWSGYHLEVRTPPRSLLELSPWLRGPVLVEGVRGRGARAPDGVVNEPEAARAVAVVEALVRDGVAPGDIAVLSPFVGQAARIGRALGRAGLTDEGGVLVRTVHKLQGGERRVVVFSITATEERHLRWLRERPHLLHVATSRAQDHLVVLLDLERAAHEAVLGPLVRAALGASPGG